MGVNKLSLTDFDLLVENSTQQIEKQEASIQGVLKFAAKALSRDASSPVLGLNQVAEQVKVLHQVVEQLKVLNEFKAAFADFKKEFDTFSNAHASTSESAKKTDAANDGAPPVAEKTKDTPDAKKPEAGKTNTPPKGMESTVYKSPMLALTQTQAKESTVFSYLNPVAQIFCSLSNADLKNSTLGPAEGAIRGYIPRLYQALTKDPQGRKFKKEEVLSDDCIALGIDALVNSYSLEGKGETLLSNLVHAQLVNRGTFASNSVVKALKDNGRVYEKSQKLGNAINSKSVKGHTDEPSQAAHSNEHPQRSKRIIEDVNENTILYRVFGHKGTWGKPNLTGLPEGNTYSKVLDHLATKLQTALFEKVNREASKIEEGAHQPPKGFVSEQLNNYLENLQQTKEGEPPLNGAKRLHQFAVLLLAACPDLGEVTLHGGEPNKARQYKVSPLLVGLSKLHGKLEYLGRNKADKDVESLCAELKDLIKTACNDRYIQRAEVGLPEGAEVDNSSTLEVSSKELLDVVANLIRNWNSGATENKFETCRAQIYNLFRDENVLQALTGMDEKQIKRLVPNLLEAALREFNKVDNGIGSADNPLGDFINKFTSATDPNGQKLQDDGLLGHIRQQFNSYLPAPEESANTLLDGSGSSSSTDSQVGMAFVNTPDPDPVVTANPDGSGSSSVTANNSSERKLIDLLNEYQKVTTPIAEDLILEAFYDGKKALNLSKTGLTALPDDLFTYLPQVEVLDLSGNQLTHLPVSLKGLENLKTLNLQTSGPLSKMSKEDIHKLLPEMKTGLVVYPDGTRAQVGFKTTDKSGDQDGNIQANHDSRSDNTGNTKHRSNDKQTPQGTESADSQQQQPTAAANSSSQQQQPTDPLIDGLKRRQPKVLSTTWNRGYS